MPGNPDWDVSVRLLSEVPVVAAALGPVAGIDALSGPIGDVERGTIDARLSAGDDLHRSVDSIAVADAESIPPVPWQMAVFAPTT